MPQGFKPEWANLPRRKCDNCGNPYRPIRPLPRDHRGFCCRKCNDEFHHHGGAYVQVKGFIRAEVIKRVKEWSPSGEPRVAAIEKRLTDLEGRFERLIGALR